MKPTWESGDVKLYLGDCLDIMPRLEKVDAVITDPPYGNGTHYKSYNDSAGNLIALVRNFMPLVIGLSSRAMITCGVANIQKYPEVDWILSWTTAAGAGSGKWGFCCWQPILVYGKDPYLQDGKGRRPDTFVFGKPSDKLDHPCPKPIEVMRWMLGRGTRQGETILDPFMGSGTTGVACVKEGRKFIGIEIAPDYFEIAKKRIQEAQMQPRLLP